MTTVILLRHGRTTANASGVLAGRAAGVKLDDVGRDQSTAAAERLAAVPLAAIVTSPLERCRQTATAVARAQKHGQAQAPRIRTDKGLTECDYGDWQGQAIKTLAKDKLWPVIQARPSSVTFPGGESMSTMSTRAVAAVRRHDSDVAQEYGDHAIWAAVSHGDVIKAIVADALGMHLDLFQRINIDPASITIVTYTSIGPYVLAVNTHAGDLSWLRPPARRRSRKAPAEAVVGGGAGPVPSSA
jgi:probable phosphomutase (TIGR03848 family)